MKYLNKILELIFICCIPLLLLSSSLAWGFNSKWLYNYGFHKYNVSLITGFSDSQLDKAADELIKYFNSTGDNLEIFLIKDEKLTELFTPEEKLHFKDVKQLVRLDYLIMLISLIFFACYFLFMFFMKEGKYRKILAKSIIWGCCITVFILTATGIASYFAFDQLFLYFHYLAFSNQYWSASGYMLLLFPGGFWAEAALFCGLFMILITLILGSIAFCLLKTKRFNNN